MNLENLTQKHNATVEFMRQMDHLHQIELAEMQDEIDLLKSHLASLEAQLNDL